MAHLLGGPAVGGLRAVVLGGTTSRGSLTPLAPAVYLLAALDQRTSGVLSQVRVEAKTNEQKAALGLFKDLARSGRVATGDAMSSQCDLSPQVVESTNTRRVAAPQRGTR